VGNLCPKHLGLGETERSNQRLEPTAASVPLAVPSSLRSSAAAQARR
jgi:hypothetical protein